MPDLSNETHLRKTDVEGYLDKKSEVMKKQKQVYNRYIYMSSSTLVWADGDFYSLDKPQTGILWICNPYKDFQQVLEELS